MRQRFAILANHTSVGALSLHILRLLDVDRGGYISSAAFGALEQAIRGTSSGNSDRWPDDCDTAVYLERLRAVHPANRGGLLSVMNQLCVVPDTDVAYPDY
jgi:hypothetical protein